MVHNFGSFHPFVRILYAANVCCQHGCPPVPFISHIGPFDKPLRMYIIDGCLERGRSFQKEYGNRLYRFQADVSEILKEFFSCPNNRFFTNSFLKKICTVVRIGPVFHDLIARCILRSSH